MCSSFCAFHLHQFLGGEDCLPALGFGLPLQLLDAWDVKLDARIWAEE